MKNKVCNDVTSSNLKGKPMTKIIGLHWLQQVTKHVPATDEVSIHRAQLRVKSLLYEKLWYLFYRYLRVSPGTMRKCMLHDSIRYQNTRSRDPITFLSMDVVVETFLEIGVSDLLVSTRCLQDPLYLEL